MCRKNWLKDDYDDGKKKEQIIVQLRIKSDEIIWLSATMLVPVAKAVILPEKIIFYEKFQKTFLFYLWRIKINSSYKTNLW